MCRRTSQEVAWSKVRMRHAGRLKFCRKLPKSLLSHASFNDAMACKREFARVFGCLSTKRTVSHARIIAVVYW